MSTESSDYLQELVRLMRVLVHPTAKTLLQETFWDKEEPKADKVRVYSLLDGTHTQTEIAKAVGVAQPTVSRWTAEWKRTGLVGSDNTAVFKISDFFPDLIRSV